MGTSKSADVQAAQALHTPLKANNNPRAAGVAIIDAQGTIVASCFGAPPKTCQEYAETIVRAVNSHAELVAACKAAKQWLIDDFSTLANSNGELSRVPVFEQLCKAIHNAEVQS